jgi:hypothetical protein
MKQKVFRQRNQEEPEELGVNCFWGKFPFFSLSQRKCRNIFDQNEKKFSDQRVLIRKQTPLRLPINSLINSQPKRAPTDRPTANPKKGNLT